MKKIYIHIHVPKTAGAFIKDLHIKSKQSKLFYPFSYYQNKESKCANNTIEQHYNLPYINKYVPTISSPDVGLFSVVRNPYDRFYSIWKYCRKLGSFGSLELPDVPEKFENFIYELCDNEYAGYYFMQSQMFFLKGMEKFDIQIFKFEEMNKIKEFLINECNLIWSDKKVNVTIGPDYKEVYSEELAILVKNKFKEEFETFGYSTDLT